MTNPPISYETTPTVRRLSAPGAEVGEGPVFDERSQSLWWVDILGQRVHRMPVDESGAADGDEWTVNVPTMPGALALTESEEVLLACREGFGVLHPDGTFDVLQHFLADGHRMNDAKCDPAGRFWAGSNAIDFAEGQGALHVLDADLSHRIALEGLNLPNGLDWSPDGSTFYLVDTHAHALYAFDFDVDSGQISEQRTLAEFDPANGLADGLSVAQDGLIYLAIWGGHRVEVIEPTGRTAGIIAMPVEQPSCTAFGRPGGNTLFVSSATSGLELGADAEDGAVFAVSGIPSVGQATRRFAGSLPAGNGPAGER